MHRSPAADHAVPEKPLAVQPEMIGPVLDEGVQFTEGTLVQQQFDPLAGGEFSALMLRLDPFLAAALERLFPQTN